MEYQKQKLVIVSKFAEETRKNLASAKGDAAKTLQQIPINEKLSKEMDAALDAKRAEVGLSQEQFEALEGAVELIANGRLLYNQMGGDAQLAKMEAESKKQIAAMPEAQRAAAEKQFADMSQSLRELKDGLELRKKYGDQAADVAAQARRRAGHAADGRAPAAVGQEVGPRAAGTPRRAYASARRARSAR